ncbi:MAG: ATP-dependent DNA helicase RecG [Candidatus Zixiibacteriota bacterium]|nr:MAG: ATP-dependent DNA helicase RecG [candidate division Zixibacteria bacterium]
MSAVNKPKPDPTPPAPREANHPHGSPDTPVQYVPGVGPQRGRQLERINVRTLEDLLYYLPRRYLDRSLIVPVRALTLSDREVTVVGKVSTFKTIGGGPLSRRFEVEIADGTGFLRGVFFQGLHWWSKAFQRGQTVAFSGKVSLYRDRIQMVHPAVDFLDEEERRGMTARTGTIISLYSSNDALARAGLDSRGLRKIMAAAVNLARGKIPEILPPELRDTYGLPEREEALVQAHFPQKEKDWKLALRRLKYEEVFLLQLSLALRQHRRKTREQGIAFPHPQPGGLTARAARHFPFELTRGQRGVLTEIRQDMESPFPMNRLLQGDVGSGKTAVVMAALAMAVEGGYQGAVMVPTEVLAEQHFRTMDPFFAGLGVPVTLLLGGLPAAARRKRLAEIASGHARVVIGTHALIQEGVEFHNLGLAVVDEQHRFGVAQRLELRRKGERPDVLVLTATPIPRSLALTLYGDLDVSLLKERPKQRQPIVTRILDGKRRDDLYDFLKTELRKERQAFIVYPLVETSEKLDLQAAVEAYGKLSQGPLHPYRLGLLHGRMSTEEKEAVMADYSAHRLDVLVSTAVVEVGIDVPNASVMAVMGAQRFGLSQLHQLRGRVGRGQHRGVCVLVVDPPMTREARDRLAVLEATEDGFAIAEEDLRIRGGGEFFGTRQSGAPDLRLADPLADRELLESARTDAFAWVARDPELEGFAPLRRHFERAYGAKMELMDVG